MRSVQCKTSSHLSICERTLAQPGRYSIITVFEPSIIAHSLWPCPHARWRAACLVYLYIPTHRRSPDTSRRSVSHACGRVAVRVPSSTRPPMRDHAPSTRRTQAAERREASPASGVSFVRRLCGVGRKSDTGTVQYRTVDVWTRYEHTTTVLNSTDCTELTDLWRPAWRGDRKIDHVAGKISSSSWGYLGTVPIGRIGCEHERLCE